MVKRSRIKRIAIVGPDGAGKTTICEALNKVIPNSLVIHAVKDQNHLLFTTSTGFNMWKSAEKISQRLGVFFQYFIFYPLEYFENLRRFTVISSARTIIYDRHPIDRVRMKFESALSNGKKSISQRIIYCLQDILGFLYLHFFPKIDGIFVLLPEINLCCERSRGQYMSNKHAENRIEAYRQAANAYARHANAVFPIEITASKTVEAVCREILDKVQCKQ